MKFRERTKEEALNEIKILVETFDNNKKSYLSNNYDEANTRADFIDKFFEILNWDVRNDKNSAERFRDVVREDKIEIQGSLKAPDYSFRIGGQKVFFVEAKKPSVDIENDIDPAYQLRRYSYTAKLPISILTDFEELAIYDTSIKPKKNDKASTSRIKFIKYNEYIKEFDFLWDTFEHSAVEQGKLDNYVGSDKKKGTATIDKDLLNTIENWRVNLASNIALRNTQLSLENLNFAVQKIIDRIVFLRIVEEKGIEQAEYLLYISDSKKGVYKELVKYFDNANERYNAGLFQKYIWLNNIEVDDSILIEIIKSLYFPECPYAWDVLPIEILGNIYEKFLGSEIIFKNVRDGKHTAKVEEKPEVRKAGGVYYTPQYIVDYIVNETLGKKLENVSIDEASKITICDPACGSGSFLVGAYRYLLNWYLEKYTKSEKVAKKNLKKEKNDYAKIEYVGDSKNKNYKLTIEEKKRILITHIYGVDIDFKATEVAKLSLFLVLLEGEGIKSSWGSQSFIQKLDYKLLPNMSDNIKCGNSLVGTDFYISNIVNSIDKELQNRINAFDWKKEFDNVFKDGGFEIVIGNPPYVKEKTNKDIFEPLHDNIIYKSKMDFWYFFIEKANCILSQNGVISIIATSDWISNDGAKNLRNFILENFTINKYIDFGNYKVFKDAGIQTMIFVIEKKLKKDDLSLLLYKKIINDKISEKDVIKYINCNINNHDCKCISQKFKNADFIDKNIKFDLTDSAIELLDKIRKKQRIFLDNKEIGQGIVPAPDECFVIDTIDNFTMKEKKYVKKWETGLLDKWINYNSTNYIIYLCDKNFKDEKLINYPHLLSHFEKYKETLKNAKIQYNTPNKAYYYLHRERDEAFFLAGNQKIVSQVRCIKPRFYYTDEEFYGSRALFFIRTNKIDLKCLSCILNSKLAEFYFRNTGKLQGNLYKIEKDALLNFPIINVQDTDVRKFSNMAEKIIIAMKNLYGATSDKEKKIAQDVVDALDKEINAKVYELYGLTKEEIAEIEKI